MYKHEDRGRTFVSYVAGQIIR